MKGTTRVRKVKSELQKRLDYLRKSVTPRHIINIELECLENDKRFTLAVSEELRIIRNTVLGEIHKNYEQMIRTKKYNSLVSDLRTVNKNIDSIKTETAETKESKKLKKALEQEKKNLNSKLDNLKTEFNVTFDYARNYGSFLREKKYNKPDAVLVLSACEIAWKSLERVMYGNAKSPRYLKKGEYLPLQGKQANRCIILKKDKNTNELYVSYNQKKFNLKIKKDDLFILESLSNIDNYIANSETIDSELVEKYNKDKTIINTFRICNNRIVIKEIRGKIKLFVQITIEGNPVPKRKKDGSFRHKLGKGKIGGDVGTQSIACATAEVAILKNLAERSTKSTFYIERKVANLQRKLDRSRRAMNPKNYNEDGTIRKGKKEWVKSNRYLKIQLQLRELQRKASESRKFAINQDVNYLRSLGDVFIIEKMNIKALQKRSKEATRNKKGRFNRRSRYGKSIQRRSPGYFISQSKKVFESTGGSLKEVNTWTFKASQYDHKLGTSNPKSLSKRWHVFEDDTKVQRDLYSAFLLLCSNDDLQSPNREICDKQFEQFLINHEKCINNIKQSKEKVLNSGIRISA